MSTISPVQPIDVPVATHALAEACVAASFAPSTHDTQPWRWRLGDDSLDLHIERSRLRNITGLDTRLATLGCGAALHHARVSLAAQGWRATVTRMPDAGDPDHLAHLRIDGHTPAPIEALTMRRAQTIRLRHAGHQPAVGHPVGRDKLHAITTAVEAEGALLHILHPDQVFDLATAADYAQGTETTTSAWQTELASWIGGTPWDDTGLPDATSRTAGPGRHKDLPSSGYDRAASFAMLYGRGDEPLDWLHAGEALSAGWLTATELGVSIPPLSATADVAATRQVMRVLLADRGTPYLMLRLGTIDPAGHQDLRAGQEPK